MAGRGESDPDEALGALYVRMLQALLDQDINTLRQTLHPDFFIVHHMGKEQPAHAFLQCVRNGVLLYYSIDMPDPKFELTGDEAFSSLDMSVDASLFGTARRIWQMSVETGFVKGSGEGDSAWKVRKMVVRQRSALLPSVPPRLD